jgi:hypothetical protein
MNNTTHTPGPLDNVTGYKPGPWIRQVLNDESEAYIHDKHCNAIARVYSLSDAALIAAAPAMYEALQIMVRAANVDEIDPLVMFASIERAKDALAQAEGRDK